MKKELFGHEIHAFANLLPMMGASEFSELKKSIEVNGIKVPVVLYEGKILDGRNRLKAAAELGILKSKIPFKTIKGSKQSAATFVSVLNLERRHLDQSQRAMAAAGIAMCSGMNQEAVADKLNASARSTSRASKVIQKGSAMLIDKVKVGEMSVAKAVKIAELPKREQNELLRSPEKTKDQKPQWKLTRQKLLANANATMRLIDELQSQKPSKNNLNIAMMNSIKTVIAKGTEWK